MSELLGFGGSHSENQSQSYGLTESGSASQSTQAIASGDLYRKLWGDASGAAAAGVADGTTLGTTARQLFTGGSNFLDSLQNPTNAGTSYQDSRLSGANPALEGAVSATLGDAGRLFTQQILPGITSGSIESGTLGNDRQGVAQGVAAGQLGQSTLSTIANMRLQDVNQRDAVAQSVAGNSLQSAATGLGALPSMMDLLTSSSAPQLGIYKTLAQIMGGPTTLTASQGMSSSYGKQSSGSSGSGNSFDFKFL